ncbi:MAG: hypothetical protein H7Y15_08455 [Pseudonocardia sp.]|nr:hypothetical protein [Pseudonocardia sp.]
MSRRVVGNGTVGARFTDGVRRRGPDGRRVALTGCGSCGDTVRGICTRLAESDPSTEEGP